MSTTRGGFDKKEDSKRNKSQDDKKEDSKRSKSQDNKRNETFHDRVMENMSTDVAGASYNDEGDIFVAPHGNHPPGWYTNPKDGAYLSKL